MLRHWDQYVCSGVHMRDLDNEKGIKVLSEGDWGIHYNDVGKINKCDDYLGKTMNKNETFQISGSDKA